MLRRFPAIKSRTKRHSGAERRGDTRTAISGIRAAISRIPEEDFKDLVVVNRKRSCSHRTDTKKVATFFLAQFIFLEQDWAYMCASQSGVKTNRWRVVRCGSRLRLYG